MKLADFRQRLKTALCSLTLAFCCLVKTAAAEEITAIDFNGDLLGKVIPDGRVVSFSNNLIGNITADSLIVNSKGEIIGGIIPQGIAIGTDNKLLGKVNNDGSVRLASGKIVGKVLPNGLVVNDTFNVIGAVLFPGLVYADDGKTVGRLTGDGLYTDLQGQQMGFVSMDGYAYRRIGLDYALDGKLISSKMVVSETGEFIGSIVPGGKVTDSSAQTIGFIHANGFAYDESGKIIGSMVRNGYAFSDDGKYQGFVTYNGGVVQGEKTVGRMAAGKFFDTEGALKGFFVEMEAVATDLNGRYLGRVLPNGKVARAREVAGTIGMGGIVFDNEGKPVGRIAKSGPVYDYLGELQALALNNGSVVSPDGVPLGYIKDSVAYDTKNQIIGSTLSFSPVIDNAGGFLGVSGITSSIGSSENSRKVSPFGYVFSVDGQAAGSLLPSDRFYGLNGSLWSMLSSSGAWSGKNKAGKLSQSGFILDDSGKILARSMAAGIVAGAVGEMIGYVSGGNLVFDKSGKVKAKILPDDAVVSITKTDDLNLSPKVGTAYSGNMAIGIKGELLGIADFSGNVSDANGSAIGKVAPANQVLDNANAYIGGIIDYDNVIDAGCSVIGITSSRGDVRSSKGVFLGRRLLNGQVFSENGSIIGYRFDKNAVVDYSGNIAGIVSANGYALGTKGESLGCIDSRGFVKNAEGQTALGLVKYAGVIGFDGKMVGRSMLDGSVVDNGGQVVGYQRPDHGVDSKTGSPLGALFEYKAAFDNNGKYIGRVSEDARVLDGKNAEIGKVTFDGRVVVDGREIGFALYDMYMYDEAFDTVGVVNKDGNVQSLAGEKTGVTDMGFLLNRESRVIARGNRDFYIRDERNGILGELSLSGKLIDSKGNILGTLQKDGEIVSESGERIAQAKPLQYYSCTYGKQKAYDSKGELIGYLNSNKDIVDETCKVVGAMQEDGMIRDSNGNIIGGIGPDWYERLDTEKKKQIQNVPQVGVVNEEDILKKSKRSMNIYARDFDGEYLCEMLEDGTCLGDDGTVYDVTPDGVVLDSGGGMKGMVDAGKQAEETTEMGNRGVGEAIGIGDKKIFVGPDGRSPAENPQAVAALSARQNARRASASVGIIPSNFDADSFNGVQKDWGLQKVISTWRVDMSEMILADKPIPAVIARSILISDDSPGQVPLTAYVERNVYSEEGRNIIIPAGSRLMGRVSGQISGGEGNEDMSASGRVSLSWERLIRPDGSAFMFGNALTGDAQGREGALGYVDEKLLERYIAPFATGLAQTGMNNYMLTGSDENRTGEGSSASADAAADARQVFNQNMDFIFQDILNRKMNGIKTVTYIPAGTRIIIYPMVDLWLITEEKAAEAKATQIAQKPTTLIAEDAMKLDGAGGRPAGNSSGGTSYNPEQSGARPKSVPLIDDSQFKKSSGTPPPPPVYVPPAVTPAAPSTNAPGSGTPGKSGSGSGSGSGSSSSSSSGSTVPALF